METAIAYVFVAVWLDERLGDLGRHARPLLGKASKGVSARGSMV